MIRSLEKIRKMMGRVIMDNLYKVQEEDLERLKANTDGMFCRRSALLYVD